MTKPDRAHTARLVARLIARRPTAERDLPELIAQVHASLCRLAEPAVASPVFVPDAPQRAVRPRRPRQPRALSPPREPAIAIEPAAPPPPPTLVRRAETVVNPIPALLAMTPGRSSTVRGIVKWYDVRHRRGALRLPGFSGDIVVESAMLTEAGVARLYKGQEVEATLDGTSEPPRLLRVSLPGGTQPRLTRTGLVRGRQAKPVVVELKTDSMRRVAARAEAEQLLRPTRPR